MKNFLLFLLLLIVGSSYCQSVTSYDASGNILVDSKPFFPFGCYGIFWENPLSEKLSSLVEMGKAGINIVCMEDIGEKDGPGFAKVLDEAQKNSIYVMIGTPYAPYMKWRAMERKKHPATFGYTICDDADNGKFTLSELATIHSEIKQEDPNHITHLTLTGWNSTRRSMASEFIAIPDLCSYQCYPICKHKDADFTKSNALTETYKRTLEYVLEAEKAKKPFIMLPQTFSWGSQSNSPCYPSVVELRNMIYSGLAAGVNGIISYDFSFDLVNNEKLLWEEFSNLAKDIKNIEGLLFQNNLTRHITNDNELIFSTWRKGDSTLFVIVNTSYNSPKNINQMISWGLGNKLIPISNRMDNGLTIEGKNIKGVLQPQSVHVYVSVPVITDVNEHLHYTPLSIESNPAFATLRILGNIYNGSTYEIFSIEGRLVQKGILDAALISVEGTEPGIYIFKAQSKTAVSMSRFIKQ